MIKIDIKKISQILNEQIGWFGGRAIGIFDKIGLLDAKAKIESVLIEEIKKSFKEKNIEADITRE